MTSADTTIINYRCASENGLSLQIPTAGSGTVLTIANNSYCYLNASSPVILVQMAPGNRADGVGDPGVAIIAPVTGHVRSASFYTLDMDIANNSITVTVRAEHFDASQILLDGITLACTWNNIRNVFTDDIVGYGCTSSVSTGTHTVSHSGDAGTLSVLAYGWNNDPNLGYAYLTNYNLGML